MKLPNVMKQTIDAQLLERLPYGSLRAVSFHDSERRVEMWRETLGQLSGNAGLPFYFQVSFERVIENLVSMPYQIVGQRSFAARWRSGDELINFFF